MKQLALTFQRRRLNRRDVAEPMRTLLATPVPAGKTRFVDSEILSLDIETTGLDPETADVLSIGWVVIQGNRVDLGSASRCVVKTEAAVGDSATVHGLTDTICREGQPLDTVLDRVVTALPGRCLLVHHAGLDKRLLDRICRQHYGTPLAVPVIDTLALELRRRQRRSQASERNSLRLPALREQYRLPYYAGHDCLADAIATAELLLAMNAGTIPDRGAFGVHLGEDGPRVGELDEEMVFETRAGDNITLGASTWHVEAITRDRVVVTPAPGEPGRLPFWRGDGPGRPIELGRAIGAFLRKLGRMSEAKASSWLAANTPLDGYAAQNLAAYVAEQKRETGTLPTDADITIERFRDELGDWRICILTPFGARIHAPWSMSLTKVLLDAWGSAAKACPADISNASSSRTLTDSPPQVRRSLC